MIVREIIVVEGRCDKSAVSQVVAGTIIETSGFGILNDNEKMALLRKLAEKCGIIILTDSDKAGFFIRGRLQGMLGNISVKHAYIPDIEGREKRKVKPSKEGKLGVEAMSHDVILKALVSAGATFIDENPQERKDGKITKTELYQLGLCGCKNSADKRRALLKQLELPQRLSANGLLNVLNILFTREEFLEYIKFGLKYASGIYTTS